MNERLGDTGRAGCRKGVTKAMAKAAKRVRLESGTDLARLLEAVHSEGTPYLIERAGVSLAVVSHPDEYGVGDAMPTEEGIARALRAAGAWEELDLDAKQIPAMILA